MGGEDQNGDHAQTREEQAGDQTRADALLRPVHLPCAQILTHKGADRHADGLHGQEQNGIHLGIGGPGGHEVLPEIIDVGLDEDVGKGSDGHLHTGGDANPDDLPQEGQVERHGFGTELDDGTCPQELDHHQNSGDPLGKRRGKGNAGNSHFEHRHEDDVQHGVHAGTDHQVIEGTLRVTHSPEDARTHVVDQQTGNAPEIDAQIGGGLRQHIGRGVVPLEHQGRQSQTQRREDRAEDQRREGGGVDGFGDFFCVMGAEMLADDHACTGGKTGKQTDEDVDDDTNGANGGVCLIGGILAHHIGVHQIVHLLEQIAKYQRQCKHQDMAGDITLGHIHILAAKGRDTHKIASFPAMVL